MTWKIPSKVFATKKCITLEIWDGSNLKKITKNIIGSNNQELLAVATKHWLVQLGEEVAGVQNIQLQSCMIDHHQQELFVSFDTSFLRQDWSIEQKLLLIESLQHTLHAICPTLTAITYLVHHKPMIDNHLSFTQAWPIPGFTGVSHNPLQIQPHGISIIIDHTGDERDRGREIFNHYEYHITSHIEEDLQNALLIRDFEVSLLRRENEWNDKEKKERLLNRLNPTLFIHFTTYIQPERTLPTFSIYYHCTDPIKDFWFNKSGNNWIKQNQAHCANLAITRAISESLYSHLLSSSTSWRIKKPCGIPSIITEGILPSSIIIEIGLPNPQAWKTIIKPLADGLQTLLLV